MRKRSSALATAVLIFGLLAAGCGDSGSGPSGETATETGPPPIAKAAFLKRANAICAAARKNVEKDYVDAIGKSQGGENAIGEIVSKVVVPDLQARVDHVRALGVPSEEEAEAAVELMQEQLEELKGDSEEFLESTARQKADEAAKRYGLTACTLGWL